MALKAKKNKMVVKSSSSSNEGEDDAKASVLDKGDFL